MAEVQPRVKNLAHSALHLRSASSGRCFLLEITMRAEPVTQRDFLVRTQVLICVLLGALLGGR
jgi:hypothetical protein